MNSAKERVREYIKSQKVSFAEAERRAGLARGYLNIDSEMSTSTLKRIITAFPNMDLEYIVTGVKNNKNSIIRSLEESVSQYKKLYETTLSQNELLNKMLKSIET